jgi:hypothetical protein
VADAFARLQEARHVADYDNGRFWGRLEAREEVNTANLSFGVWAELRGENIAQEYLVSLLIRPRD